MGGGILFFRPSLPHFRFFNWTPLPHYTIMRCTPSLHSCVFMVIASIFNIEIPPHLIFSDWTPPLSHYIIIA